MRLLGFIVAASIGLALFQAAAKLALLLAIIIGLGAFLARPKETAGCLFGLVCLGAMGRHPVVACTVIAGVLAFGFVSRRMAAMEDADDT